MLGINEDGIAVGFYTDGNGVNHAYLLNRKTGKFTEIIPPNATSATATGINDHGDVTGFLTEANGNTLGFLLRGKTFTEFSFSGSTNTTPFGINNADQIVGFYVDGAGNTDGFLANPKKQAVIYHSCLALLQTAEEGDPGEQTNPFSWVSLLRSCFSEAQRVCFLHTSNGGISYEVQHEQGVPNHISPLSRPFFRWEHSPAFPRSRWFCAWLYVLLSERKNRLYGCVQVTCSSPVCLAVERANGFSPGG